MFPSRVGSADRINIKGRATMGDHTDLLHKLESLTEEFSHLRGLLAQAVKDLLDPGLPPSENLIEQQAAARRRLIDLRTEVLDLAKSVEVSPIPEPHEIASIGDLKSLFRAVVEAEEKKATKEQVRRHALEILDHIFLIVHQDTPDFPSLRECQAQARELRDTISEASRSELSSAVYTLTGGTHPLSALLTLVKRFEELDNKEWESLHDILVSSFDKSLVTAIVRRKIVLQSELPLKVPATAAAPSGERSSHVSPSEATDVASAEQSAVAAFEQTGTEEGSVGPKGTTQEVKEDKDKAPDGSLIEPTPVKDERKLSGATANGIERVAQDKTPSETFSPAPAASFGADATAQQIAGSILNGPAEDRPTAFRNLVCRLIFEDKLALAFHTVRGLETLYPDPPPPFPAWLVRATALGRHVCHPTGGLANLTERGFQSVQRRFFCLWRQRMESRDAVPSGRSGFTSYPTRSKYDSLSNSSFAPYERGA